MSTQRDLRGSSEIEGRIIDTQRREKEAREAGNRRRASALRGVVTRLRKQQAEVGLAWPVARSEDESERMEMIDRMAPGYERTMAHRELCYRIGHGSQSDVDATAARFAALGTPGAVAVTEGAGWHDGREVWPHDGDGEAPRWVAFYDAEHEVRVVVVVQVAEEWLWRDGRRPRVEVTGHTLYRLDGSWWSFTRRGVDVGSFSYTAGEDPRGIVAGQMRRAREKQSARAGMVPVPGLPGLSPRIPPARVAVDREALDAGGTVTFKPGGFGMGWRVSRRRPHQFARAADESLCIFYGFESLWLEALDFD